MRKSYQGPALFSYGFRPFFLIAIIFAALIIPFWVAVYLGYAPLAGPFAPVDWHVHEMLFGYAAAVITGFLFTAIPNWTGRMPVQGWPLATLTIIWVAGRLSMAGVGGLPPLMVMFIDIAFLGAIGIIIVIEIVKGRNWRNLMVIIPVLLFLSANILFHLEILSKGEAVYGRRMGLSVVLFLITLIGGRVIPSFTRNWLVKFNPGKLPTPFNRFDGVSLLTGLAALTLWTVLPDARVTGWVLILAAALHLLRLSRWQGQRTAAAPLLLMLHIAYGFIPIGWVVLGLGAELAAVHLLGIGAVGGMTLAVMIRATLGHTGRPLEIHRDLVASFILIILAAILRSVAPYSGTAILVLAAVLWTSGFAIALIRVGPWLCSPRVKAKTPNR